MKRKWIPIALVTSLGVLTILSAAVISIANKINYDVLSYQVQYLDSDGITIRVLIAITNPSRFDIEVWNQKYDVFVAGYQVSEITSTEQYKILADNTSTIPLDIYLKWSDINDKIMPIASQSGITSIGDLPVLVKGRLAAKSGLLKLSKIPVRIPTKLGYYLP